MQNAMSNHKSKKNVINRKQKLKTQCLKFYDKGGKGSHSRYYAHCSLSF